MKLIKLKREENRIHIVYGLEDLPEPPEYIEPISLKKRILEFICIILAFVIINVLFLRKKTKSLSYLVYTSLIKSIHCLLIYLSESIKKCISQSKTYLRYFSTLIKNLKSRCIYQIGISQEFLKRSIEGIRVYIIKERDRVSNLVIILSKLGNAKRAELRRAGFIFMAVLFLYFLFLSALPGNERILPFVCGLNECTGLNGDATLADCNAYGGCNGGPVFAIYNEAGSGQCCGDDSTQEWVITETGAADAPSTYKDGTQGCCNVATDCTLNGASCTVSGGVNSGVYCNSGTWQGGDDSSTACTAISASYEWLTSGSPTTYDPCCGDDSGEDFNSTDASGRCCYNADALSSGGSSGSILCYLGKMYDCNNGDASETVASTVTTSCTAVGSYYCNADNTWKLTLPNGCSCTSDTGQCTGDCDNQTFIGLGTDSLTCFSAGACHNSGVSYCNDSMYRCEYESGAAATCDDWMDNTCYGSTGYCDSSCAFYTLTTPTSLDIKINFSYSLNSNSGGLNLTWSDSSTGESWYNIFRSTDNITFTNIGNTSTSNVYNYNDNNLLDNQVYYYKVRAASAGTSPNCTNATNTTVTYNITADRTAPTIADLNLRNYSNYVDLNWSEGDNGLVLYMPFEEGTGTKTDDWSDQLNNGTISGASWITQNCKSGNCLYFGGSHYVDAGNKSSLKQTNDFTMMAWVNRTSAGNTFVMASFSNPTGGGAGILIGSSGEVYCRTDSGSGFTDSYTPIGFITSSTGWNHVAIVRNGTACNVYINGINRTSSKGVHTTVKAANFSLKIGGRGELGGEFYTGYIDEVRVYNRSLTQREIINDMQSGLIKKGLFRSTTEGGTYTQIGGMNFSDNNYTDTGATDTADPGEATSLSSTSHTTSMWSRDNTVDLTWASATDTGTEYWYKITAYDTNTNYNTSAAEGLGSSPWCYQETATSSTVCGGLNTGSYTTSGTWTSGGNAVFDGDWGTGDYSFGGSGTYAYLDINYSKPTGATTDSVWQVKDGNGQRNLTIVSSCWGNEKLMLKIESFGDDMGSDYYLNWYCLDSSKSLVSLGDTTGDSMVWEEAMWWNFGTFTGVTSGVDGYDIGCNQTSGDLASTTKDYEETQTTHTCTFPDGSLNYFHIKTVDGAGNWDDTSADIGPFYIDATGLTICGIEEINESTPYAHVSGTTIYYNTDVTGYFTVNVSAADSASGVSNVTFPTTVSAGTIDTAYQYMYTYGWDTSDIYDSQGTLTCGDIAGNSNTTTFTVALDTSGVTDGSVNYTNGISSVSIITFSDGTDTGSGVNSSTGKLLRRSAAVNDNNTCGTYSSWSQVGSFDPSSPYSDSLTAVNCYEYRYEIFDNVMNGVNYTSTNVLRYDNIPTQDAPTISPTNPNVTSNLTCNWNNVADTDGHKVTNITNWYNNNKSMTLLYFPFEGNEGYETTNATDYSGYDNNGTVFGAQFNRTGGKVGGAYVFDPNNNNYIYARGNEASIFTVSAWIKTTSISNWKGIIEYTDSSNRRKGIGLNQSGHVYVIYGTSQYRLSSAEVDNGLWHHVVGLYDGSNAYVYVDGQSYSLGSANSGSSGLNSGLRIGNMAVNAISYYFNGTIDEVKIFNSSLSSAQILAEYQAGLANRTNNLIVSEELSQTDGWKCSVTPNDGYSDGATVNSTLVTMENTAPTVTSLTLTPNAPNTSSEINCNATIADPEETIVNVEYWWYNNSIFSHGGNKSDVIVNANTVITTLGNGNTTKGQNWNCTIRVYDGLAYSGYNSTNAVIQNAPPSKPTLTRPTNNNVTVHERMPFFDWENSTDIDGDLVNYTINITFRSALSCGPMISTNASQSNYTATYDYCVDTPINWTVRAYDGEGYGEWSNFSNFTIESYIAFNLTTDSIDFGTMNVLETRDTDNGYNPLIIENIGNVMLNISKISANASPFQIAGLNTMYFRFKADNTTEMPSFNYTASAVNWTNLTDVSLLNSTLIKQLDYNDSHDTAQIDINITVPLNEPGGQKRVTLYIIGEAS